MSDSEPPLTRRAAKQAGNRRPGGDSRKAPAAPKPDPATGEPMAPMGLATLIARHPTAWLASALGVVFLLLGTGALFAGAATGNGDPAPTPSSEPTEAGPRPVPEAIPGATRLRTCSVAALAADPRLMSLKGYVMNATSGDVLFDRDGTTPNRTGSVLKILTASAAISVLGPDYRLSTKVMDGSRAGSIVLVGGGDATLSSLTGGAESYYQGAPKLQTLAAQVTAAYAQLHPGVPITEVVLDATYWDPADKWDPVWKRSEQTIGYHSEVTALQVDGDRADPTRGTSPRSTDPIGRAGKEFVKAMGLTGVTFTQGAAVTSTLLGEVKSQPVSTLISQMLMPSDNTLAEMLARVVSVEMGLGGSAASLQQAIPGALDKFGPDATKLVIKDGSGLSEQNAVPPVYIAQLMVKVLGGGQDLSYVYNSLPVAGKSGSLAGRFTGANAIARGAVVAKTGWIDTAYSLGGVVKTADGTLLTFAFYAIGDGIRDTAKVALDTLTTGVYNCGDNLSNN